MRILKGLEQFGTIKAICQMDGWMGWDGMGYLNRSITRSPYGDNNNDDIALRKGCPIKKKT